MNEVYIVLKNEKECIKDLFPKQDLVSVDELISKLEELIDEVKHKDEEMEEYKQYVNDNYKHLSYEEQVL